MPCIVNFTASVFHQLNALPVNLKVSVPVFVCLNEFVSVFKLGSWQSMS